MRPFRSFALAVLAMAAPVAVHALDLVSPQNGVSLRGGTIATIEWKAAELPPNAEEWEAFLSIDGGHYYGYRITPHLDISIRRFAFLVPNVDATRARIMIRTGDEERETRFELPASFAIARDPHAAARVRAMLEPRGAESAREGDPPVLEWAEGSRDGSGVKEREAAPATHCALVSASADPVETASTLAPDQLTLTLRCLPASRVQPNAARSSASATESRASDLLLVCSRLNI